MHIVVACMHDDYCNKNTNLHFLIILLRFGESIKKLSSMELLLKIGYWVDSFFYKFEKLVSSYKNFPSIIEITCFGNEN